jgi:hypothetical protein
MYYIWVMPTSNWKGQLAVGKVQTRALELGYIPSIPFVDCRYDLILEDKQRKLWRVQVKYANGRSMHSSGSVTANLAYETRHRRNVITYNESEVDALIVYVPKLDKLCWFPCEAFVGKKELSIRLDPPLNGQKTKIYYAHDYFW